ncbi:MAG: acetylxylan esterase [Pirellulaceae bacterium]|jgi:cephalosporin-C deacetylase-like acetyl esterase|nr:acetylxylan esterase [Thermoguttaceae bacterium]NLZ00093.1 acetylxylan esterase [Pirellulaceae bacterium]
MARSVPFQSASVILLLTVVCAAQAAPQANLVPNAGFETADAGGPAFWARRTPSDADRTLSWDDRVSHRGQRSLKIENAGAVISRWRWGHLRDATLETGSRGMLRGWIKTENVADRAFLRLYFMDSADQILRQPDSSQVSGTSDWTAVQLPFTVPDGTAFIMIYLELTGTGAAWFDDLELTGVAGQVPAAAALPELVYGLGEFDRLDGCLVQPGGKQAILRLARQSTRGSAGCEFWGESARYDIRVRYAAPPKGEPTARLMLNDRPLAEWTLAAQAETASAEKGLAEMWIRGVNVQQRSRVAFQWEGGPGDVCGLVAIGFRPVGRFAGEFLSADALQPEPTLRLYPEPGARQRAKEMLPSFVGKQVAGAAERRKQELAALATPEQWRRRQEQVRAGLVAMFGDFGPKCPLNARITGKLDRPQYTIEKLIFESQPGYHCTANVYLPKNRELPAPAVLFTCGHAAEGKAYHLYHETCLGFVLKGYVVLALDPTGQGERSEYFDPATGDPLVPLTVMQHVYLGRPSFLVGRTLAGYRTWDAVRALDYLESRPEVDGEQLVAVGNSGGGIMALLITAYDERIKVCAAAHPGGPYEQLFLTGRSIPESDVLSLIPPRPCAMIVGRDSGEIAGHQGKLDRMMPFYEGLGVGGERAEMILVDGVHNMEKPKREAAYGWVNRWLNREAEGAQEPLLAPETVTDLNCTETGFAVRDLGGETGQTLNAKRAAAWRAPRAVPADRPAIEAARSSLRERIARRLGLNVPAKRSAPRVTEAGGFETEDLLIERLSIESEAGIELPSVLLRPKKGSPKPVILHVAELGKPTSTSQSSLALALARAGHVVFSVDVRGAGETDPRVRSTLLPLTRPDHQQWRFDFCAADSAQAGTTILAMRVLDVVRATDYLAGRADLRDRSIMLVGEGLGGVWALAAAAFDDRPGGVVCVRTVPSYRLVVGSQYYLVRDYFWTPGALRDFDLPDLAALAAPRRVMLIDPVDAMLERVDLDRCRSLHGWAKELYRALGSPEALQYRQTPDGTVEALSGQITSAFGRLDSR